MLRDGIAERARDLVRQIRAARDFVTVWGSVSPDPIHLLLGASPTLAPAKLAQYIKGSIIYKNGSSGESVGNLRV
jgi:putative transposase